MFRTSLFEVGGASRRDTATRHDRGVAFRQPDETLDEAVAAMFERARRNEKSAPRKHHVIPASYLARWQRDGQVRVTETDAKRTYTTSPEKAARETDFYSLASEDLDSHEIPPLLMETILSQIEGSAKSIIDRLLEGGPGALSALDALGFAQFLAFQVTRGRAFRAQIMAMANAGMLKMWEGVSDQGIAARLREQGSDSSPGAVAAIRETLDEWKDGHWTVAPQPAALVGYAAAAAEPLAMTFLARPWRIYQSVMPMITCDEPVVPVPRPRGDRGEYAGLATAGVVLFPLDPHHLVAMFHPYLALDEVALHPELCPSEADEINLELAGHSDRWLFERPNHSRSLTLTVPRHAPTRAVLESINVANRPEDEFFRGYRPTRWHASLRRPPLPVERWWRQGRSPGLHDLPFDVETMPFALFNSLS